jgi:hypothetical protein
MTIPKDKQNKFVSFFNETLGPTFQGFGAKKHELYKVADKPIVGKQLTEENRFIERVYFDEGFDLPTYFARVKENEEAWKLSRSYEEKFGATNIELRVLMEPTSA